MRRRNPGRPPYAFAPLMMALFGFSLWYMGGANPYLRGLVGLPADPAEVASHVESGIDAQRGGDTHRADDEFRRAVASGDGSAVAFVDVGQTLVQRDLAPPAVNLLLPATTDKSAAWDPMLWATLASAYQRQDDKKDADSALAHAETAAAALYATGATAQAITQADRNEESLRLRELARYYDEQKQDSGKATEMLRIAARLNPSDWETLRSLGYLLADKGKTARDRSEAVDWARQAVARIDLLQPDSILAGEARHALGWALFQSGDREGARRVLMEAATDAPTDAQIHYHAGLVYAALGAPADAAVEFDRAVQLQPTFAEAAAARKALPPVVATPTPTPSPSGFPLTLPTDTSATLSPVARPSVQPSVQPAALPALAQPVQNGSKAPVLGDSEKSVPR